MPQKLDRGSRVNAKEFPFLLMPLVVFIAISKKPKFMSDTINLLLPENTITTNTETLQHLM